MNTDQPSYETFGIQPRKPFNRSPPTLNLLTTPDMKSNFTIIPQREGLHQRIYTLRGAPLLSIDSLKNTHRDAFLCVTNGGSDAYNRFLAKGVLKYATPWRGSLNLLPVSPVLHGIKKGTSQDKWDSYIDWSRQLIDQAPGTVLARAFIESSSRAEEVHGAFQAYFEPRMTAYLCEHEYTTEKGEYIIAKHKNTRAQMWILEEKIKNFVDKEEVRRQIWSASHAIFQANQSTGVASPVPGFQNITSNSTIVHGYESDYEDIDSIFSRRIYSRTSSRNTSAPNSPTEYPTDNPNLEKSLPREEIEIQKRHEHALAEKKKMLERVRSTLEKYAAAYRTYANIFIPYAKKLTLEFEEKWALLGPYTQYPAESKHVRFGRTEFDTIKTLLTIESLRHGLCFNESNPLVYENYPNENELDQRRKEPGFHSLRFCGRLADTEQFRSFITAIGRVIHKAHKRGEIPLSVIMPPEEFEPSEDVMRGLGVKFIKKWNSRSLREHRRSVAKRCRQSSKAVQEFKDMTMISIVNSGLRRMKANVELFEMAENDVQGLLGALPEDLELGTSAKSCKRGSSEMSGGETYKHFKTKAEQRHFEANSEGSQDDKDAIDEEAPETSGFHTPGLNRFGKPKIC